MVGRDNVIKGLREISDYFFNMYRLSTESYETAKAKDRCDIIEDAISMLKEQESVVHPEPSCEMTYITDCCCDLCGVQLIREDNFCRCCGKHIEWEGR